MRDSIGGIALILGALTGLVVMALHPTAHDLMSAGGFARHAHLNAGAHAFALVGVPLQLFGLLYVVRRLGYTDATVAALVAWGFGSVAVLSAAVASGFVATDMIEAWLEAEGPARETYHALLDLTGHLNQGFAKVDLVATCAGMALASLSIVRTRRMPFAAGIYGIVAAAVLLVGFLVGHLRLNVHGFGIVVLAQSVWLVWLGVSLFRKGPSIE